MNVVNIKDLSPKELEDFIINLGEKPYRAVQLAKWVYKRRVTSFDEMTDLPNGLRAGLGVVAKISYLKPPLERVSSDGTKKYVFELFDGNRIESVLIPENGRATLCVSTQVGCALDCTFCLTGRIGRIRNLDPSEILDQYIGVNNLNNQSITNIVFMGMGEPLDNLESTVKALKTFTNPDFIGFSPKKITVSTSGIVPKIKELGEQISVNLSVSLNAARDDLRDEIMPINKRYPIKELIEESARFPIPKRKTLTFEYVLIENVNDSDEDARRLGELLMGVKCKVNLIPFNEADPLPYKSPAEERVFGFQKALISYGINVRIRKNRGRDILGACGQLAADYPFKNIKPSKFSGKLK
ncbi:MAG: 23S rRNA (adenine(2503)-C(2))-methyltransferase RlmN [Candidatus Dadabacteria bacterium]|nr:23S rRNA (adenine(2503)-C(2))-methyltransferase RlmN [Candidatus Dadabacteria bacterium]